MLGRVARPTSPTTPRRRMACPPGQRRLAARPGLRPGRGRRGGPSPRREGRGPGRPRAGASGRRQDQHRLTQGRAPRTGADVLPSSRRRELAGAHPRQPDVLAAGRRALRGGGRRRPGGRPRLGAGPAQRVADHGAAQPRRGAHPHRWTRRGTVAPAPRLRLLPAAGAAPRRVEPLRPGGAPPRPGPARAGPHGVLRGHRAGAGGPGVAGPRAGARGAGPPARGGAARGGPDGGRGGAGPGAGGAAAVRADRVRRGRPRGRGAGGCGASAADAAAAARQDQALDLLADALELAGRAEADAARAEAFLLQAHSIWRDGGAGPDADRVDVLLGRLEGAGREAERRGRDAAHRLQRLGVARVGGRSTAEDPVGRHVRIQLLARFEVSVGGMPISLKTWKSRQARTLVKVLAARRGRPVRAGLSCASCCGPTTTRSRPRTGCPCC